MKHHCSYRKTEGTKKSCYMAVLRFEREADLDMKKAYIWLTWSVVLYVDIIKLSVWTNFNTRLVFSVSHTKLVGVDDAWEGRVCGASPLLKPINVIEATKGGIQRDSMIQNYGGQTLGINAIPLDASSSCSKNIQKPP